MTVSQPENQTANLYDRDFCLWAEETAKLLQAGKFGQIDLEHLIEEVEDMSGSQKRALLSNLRVLLMHLLKYKYQSEKRSKSWRHTIVEHRIRLEDAFEESPSLREYCLEIFDKAYQKARKQAAEETELPLDTFPRESPFTPAQILDEDFFPD
ncbi:DUF29 domain-containing protein [Aerosakkonema sp. BLCC-F183]|uniref:DUF29 domain-containing protein n=1 Tax=Aerosakkonema sp. BLCC-F183 TaxID=3342834 RepID=UPI0035B786DD